MPGNYPFISAEQKWLVLTMSLHGMLIRDIVSVTGICKRTMRRVRSTWKDTGDVVRRSLENGRQRSLSSLEVLYLESLVEKQPDIYARELQHALFMAYDVEVDTTTITRALHRHGFTCKNI
ncbi:hypothetical protein K443DRAFT_75422, partial [Laccaria amethystina LaAM-08-1]